MEEVAVLGDLLHIQAEDIGVIAIIMAQVIEGNRSRIGKCNSYLYLLA